MRNLRRGIKTVAIFLLSLSVAGVTAPIAGAQTGNPNNFTIQSFTADYYLSRNAEGASTMRVEEDIVALFPHFDQSRGIERAIPEKYDGHTLRLNIQEVTDGEGHVVQYETRSENDNTILRIGDPDAFAQGRQTYTIEYAYENVTKNYDTHDELYWDTNGTQWQQPFRELVARLHVDESLAGALNGQVRCFVGVQGSSESCQSEETTQGDGSKTLTFRPGRSLASGENLSFVVGFSSGTFSPYVPSAGERVWQAILTFAVIMWILAAIIVPTIMIILLVKAWKKYGKPPKGRGTIIPEYLPPKNTSVLMSAEVAKAPQHTVTAQLIDLAVRHYIKIYEIKSKKLFKKESFELEIIKSPHDLREDEKELFDLVFVGEQKIGTKVQLDEIANKRYKQMQELTKNMRERAESDGYFIRHKQQQRKFNIIGTILLVGSIVTLNIPIFIMAIVTYIVVYQLRPRTEKGVELMEYLEGLKMYMKLAEAERLKVLQSPQGADRVDAGDEKQMIKLYERILPYAILFGVEKEWGEQFTHISDQAPDWYVGSSPTFNAILFVGAVNSFTTATTSSFSAPTSSSSSGLSGGGGFSGGGGGGGGGGGW